MDNAATPETGPVDASDTMAGVLAELRQSDEPKPDTIDEVVAELKEVKKPEDDGQAPVAPGAEESATDPIEPDEEAEEGDPEGDDDGDDNPPADDPIVTVKVNGEDVEVPLSEALKGYSRTEDYKAKTMALADERRQVEAQKATIEADVRGQYANELKQTIDLFEQLDPVLQEARQIDWDALKAQDPATYVQMSDAVQQRIDLINGHRAHIAGIEQEQQARAQQAEQAERVQRFETAANKMVELMPELAEGENFQTFTKDTLGYLREVGFTPDEIAEALDERSLTMAHEARQWRQLQAAKKGLPEKKIVPKSAVKAMTSDAAGSSRSSKPKLRAGASRDEAVAFALKELRKE